MSELSEMLQSLCNDIGTSNTALARRAGIDRPTFLHFLTGKRRPTQENLEKMLLALQATPSQRKEIFRIYTEEAISPALRCQREGVANLLRRVFEVNEKHISAPKMEISTSVLSKLDTRRENVYLHNRSEIEMALYQMLSSYCANPTGPLMLPAQLKGEWLTLIAGVLASLQGGGEIWHLSTFLRDGAGRDSSAHNLQALADSIPFAYLSNIKYEAKFAYVMDDEPLPGELSAGYVLFPDAMLVMERESKGGEIRRAPNFVAAAHRIFREDYVGANDYIRIDTDNVNGVEARVDATRKMDELGHRTWNLRLEPELIPVLDEDALKEAIIVPQEENPKLYEMMFRRVREISALPLSCYFSLRGVREFLETGMSYEVPNEVYRPLSPQRRIEVLERIIQRIEDDQCGDRLINDCLLLPPTGFYLTAVEGHSVNFFQEPREHGGLVARVCSLTETSLCDAIVEFLDNMPQTEYALSKEETLVRLRRLLSNFMASTK